VTTHFNPSTSNAQRYPLKWHEGSRSHQETLITQRQIECLIWVRQGKSATDIGCILGLSGRTVEKHLTKLCGHLGVKTRVQAVVRALELGLIGPNGP